MHATPTRKQQRPHVVGLTASLECLAPAGGNGGANANANGDAASVAGESGLLANLDAQLVTVPPELL